MREKEIFIEHLDKRKQEQSYTFCSNLIVGLLPGVVPMVDAFISGSLSGRASFKDYLINHAFLLADMVRGGVVLVGFAINSQVPILFLAALTINAGVGYVEAEIAHRRLEKFVKNPC